MLPIPDPLHGLGSFYSAAALAKKLPQQQALVRTGRWTGTGIHGRDLIGKTLGIIGLGKTGTELARLVMPFHMHLLPTLQCRSSARRIPGMCNW